MANKTGELTGGGVSGGQIFGLIAVFAVCTAAGYLVSPSIVPLLESGPEQVVEEPVQVELPPLPQEDPMGIPVIQEIAPSTFAGGTYSIAVTAGAPNGQAVEYVLYDYDDVELKRSGDGVFDEVAPSDSVYRIVVINLVTGQRSNEAEVCDCVVPRPVVDKVSISKLSTMINSGNYSENFSRYWIREHAPSCRLKFSGLKDGEIVPDSFADLCDRVNLEGWRCTVSKIEYNDMNQMTAVYIVVTYSE